jgi:hypothetical protein
VAEQARREALSGLGRSVGWATAYVELDRSIAETNALNLDRRQFAVHAFETLQDAASRS